MLYPVPVAYIYTHIDITLWTLSPSFFLRILFLYPEKNKAIFYFSNFFSQSEKETLLPKFMCSLLSSSERLRLFSFLLTWKFNFFLIIFVFSYLCVLIFLSFRVLRVFVERLVLQFVHFTITLCNFSVWTLSLCCELSSRCFSLK